MSEIETSEVRDPEIPAMVFGRPPTRPGSRGDEVAAAHDEQQDDVDVPVVGGLDVREGDEVPDEHGEVRRDVEVVSGGREDEPGGGSLLVSAADLRKRWESVQAAFVDDPRAAVEAAAGMVSEAAAALQAEIERRRAALADSRHGEADGSTDALLAAFRDYRELFDRVVSA
jgi:hypothetical protein